MICYLVRHGKDDDSVRGGWSNSPLTEKGIWQVNRLAAEIQSANNMNIGILFSSDLPRAKQTADILSSALSVQVITISDFREANNGILAGMNNQLAEEQYPGLYWNTLEWEQTYPQGESPCQFYNRIADAWSKFKNSVQGLSTNIILVTHGGVINVIQCIEQGLVYSNKANPFPLGYAEMVGIEL